MFHSGSHQVSLDYSLQNREYGSTSVNKSHTQKETERDQRRISWGMDMNLSLYVPQEHP
jgi:hypothetical protein